MIPKIIHYCWVGGAPKPPSVLYCIESWKKYCPDYEIREWNEENYNFFKNEYMRQAYEAKKWGFVPDYARLDIVYQYGGIYLDTDVEIIKNFDGLLKQDAFMGFEETGIGEYFVNCGQGFGATPGNPVIKAARDLYDQLNFRNKDGSINQLASPHYTTQALRQFGLIQKNSYQQLEGVTIYPTEVLCPKNFTTGKINITKDTFSIHHFTASWLDDQIKKDLEHQSKIKNKFGEKLGSKILYGQSVLEKYGSIRMMRKVPEKIIKKGKHIIVEGIESYPYYKGLNKAWHSTNGAENPIILDTAMNSENLGDQIIMENCLRQLQEGMEVEPLLHVATHTTISSYDRECLSKARYKILCGTNVISGHMRTYGLWKLGSDVSPYTNTVLMGVGMADFNQTFDKYTQRLFKTILSSDFIHSVRDSETEQFLKNMGISNVINTGCPTMWSLTHEQCEMIPKSKGNSVVCTITDYNKNFEQDRKMLEILLDEYKEVYFWIQGSKDLSYLQELGYFDKVHIIDATLEAYDKILALKNLDYVGTRLHAGIRALATGHRSIIISIDNRAESIATDTGLPIILREDIHAYLRNKIHSKFKTEINMNGENIKLWKEQFVYEKNKNKI